MRAVLEVVVRHDINTTTLWIRLSSVVNILVFPYKISRSLPRLTVGQYILMYLYAETKSGKKAAKADHGGFRLFGSRPNTTSSSYVSTNVKEKQQVYILIVSRRGVSVALDE